MDAFDASRWIFVGDMDLCEHSRKQVAVCKALKLDIKGAIHQRPPSYADSYERPKAGHTKAARAESPLEFDYF